ncbi:hypothetical protein ACQPYK_08710 [Streptosporangium sp. CA-135522]|uniref:hypothetical protein n=1 Tax=Streptosporangium sp. CA-135522 TaxID=3240072 RepID=UPI003D8BF58A
MMVVSLTLLIALAAALLGVAAARRGWWIHATITGVCTLLAVYAAAYLAGSPVVVTPPVWVSVLIAWLIVDALILTAWSVLRAAEKTAEASRG